MGSTDLKKLQRRARLKYEWHRARRAVVGFAPALLVVVIAALFAKRLGSTLLFGSLMFASGALLLWYGRDVRRAVLPGVAAGILPLTLAVCANHIGHACSGERCMMLCVPACAFGGLFAGLAVAVVAQRGEHRAGFWVGASALALLTGAMGCACVGYSGVGGLALGFLAGLIPPVFRRLPTA